jgi:hypothetical protein
MQTESEMALVKNLLKSSKGKTIISFVSAKQMCNGTQDIRTSLNVTAANYLSLNPKENRSLLKKNNESRCESLIERISNLHKGNIHIKPVGIHEMCNATQDYDPIIDFL